MYDNRYENYMNCIYCRRSGTCHEVGSALRFFRFDDDAQKVVGLASDVFTLATVLMSSMFLGSALLKVASQVVLEQNRFLITKNIVYHKEQK